MEIRIAQVGTSRVALQHLAQLEPFERCIILASVILSKKIRKAVRIPNAAAIIFSMIRRARTGPG